MGKNPQNGSPFKIGAIVSQSNSQQARRTVIAFLLIIPSSLMFFAKHDAQPEVFPAFLLQCGRK
ncbi:MAG: hypothetical protein AAFO95_10000 [Cyanobacteria bacterium J06600_6]